MKLVLVVLFLGIISNAAVKCCDLVPDFDGSCMDLEASSYITEAMSQFGPFIEGASVNPAGDMFAVNFGDHNTAFQLGQIWPTQRFFYRDEDTNTWMNGIRFINATTAFVVDAVNHRVLKLTINETNDVVGSETHCSDSQMIQPNDLTLSFTGTIFTSGMRWLADTNNTNGDLWSCLPDGTATLLDVMGRTNGIELSPDEKWLYVSEAYNREGVPYVQRIFRYRVDVEQGFFWTKQLFIDFGRLDGSVIADVDGMKTDINGNLFVSRYDGSGIAIFNQEAELIGRIRTHFVQPTNLEFGGRNGTTLFIVGKCVENGFEGKGCVDTIEMSNPGRSWSKLQQPTEKI